MIRPSAFAIGALVGTMGIAPGDAFAATTGALDDTGQQQCHDTVSVQPCEPAGFPGQDARSGRDAAATDGILTKSGGGAAAFDFTKVSNSGADLPESAAEGAGPGDWGCTRDNVTGLLWMERPAVGAFTWTQAAVYAAGLNSGSGLCGRTDWRVPRIRELQGLTHYGTSVTPLYDKTYFRPAGGGFGTPYWASEPSVYAPEVFPDWAWYIGVGAGLLTISPKSDLHGVRAVSGAPASGPKVNQADGTVLDTSSGLIFDRCALGQTLSGGVCTGTAATYTWQGALNQVPANNEQNHLGHNDWRLPNVKELAVLVDYGQYDDASDSPYWTSTPYAEYQGSAEVVNLGVGYAYEVDMTNAERVRLVRGGSGLSAYSPPDASFIFGNGFE